MRIILDTGVFYYPDALSALVSSDRPVIVPATAYAERLRQLARDGRDLQEFERLLDRARFVPEALDPQAAGAVAGRVTSDPAWKRLARDAFVAAHVGPGDQLWTTNPRDFLELGVSAAQVVAIPRD